LCLLAVAWCTQYKLLNDKRARGSVSGLWNALDMMMGCLGNYIKLNQHRTHCLKRQNVLPLLRLLSILTCHILTLGLESKIDGRQDIPEPTAIWRSIHWERLGRQIYPIFIEGETKKPGKGRVLSGKVWSF
jgi:hypothetical protein